MLLTNCLFWGICFPLELCCLTEEDSEFSHLLRGGGGEHGVKILYEWCIIYLTLFSSSLGWYYCFLLLDESLGIREVWDLAFLETKLGILTFTSRGSISKPNRHGSSVLFCMKSIPCGMVECCTTGSVEHWPPSSLGAFSWCRCPAQSLADLAALLGPVIVCVGLTLPLL